MDLKSFEFETPFIGIIKFSSEITRAVLDRCVTRDICPNIHSDLIVKTYLKIILFDYILIIDYLARIAVKYSSQYK